MANNGASTTLLPATDGEGGSPSLQDSVDDFMKLTTIPEAFDSGPVKGIALPVTIRVGKPDGARFVMIDPDRSREMLMLQDPNKLAGRTGNLYAVRSDIAERLLQEFPAFARSLRKHEVYIATYRLSRELVLMPLKLPTDHPMSVDAYEAAMHWVRLCMKDWHVVTFNMEDKKYETTSTEVPNQEKANFEDLYRGQDFGKILHKGFRDHFIQDWDHAVLRAMRGV